MKDFRKSLVCICGALLLLTPLCAVLGQAQGTNTASVTVQTDKPVETLSTMLRVDAERQLSFGLDRMTELRFEVLGIPLWQYIATALYVVLAVLAAKLFDYLVSVQLRKITARTKNTIDDLLVDLLH